MIEIRDLLFCYERQGFHLRIPLFVARRGEKVAVLGPSGCGKTTFLKLLAGIEVPQRGVVLVDGADLARCSDTKRRHFRSSRIGFVFQEFELLDYLPIVENMLLPFRISRSANFSTSVREAAMSLARDLGLADKLRQRPAQLSHGERQRVAIARALVTRPAILLADEPTGNLDPANKHSIKSLLFDQASLSEALLIYVTHDHGMLSGFDRVIDFNEFLPEVVR